MLNFPMYYMAVSGIADDNRALMFSPDGREAGWLFFSTFFLAGTYLAHVRESVPSASYNTLNDMSEFASWLKHIQQPGEDRPTNIVYIDAGAASETVVPVQEFLNSLLRRQVGQN